MNFIKHLKLKVPPPILTVVFIFSNYFSTYFFYSFQFKYQELISLLIFILGLFLLFWLVDSITNLTLQLIH